MPERVVGVKIREVVVMVDVQDKGHMGHCKPFKVLQLPSNIIHTYMFVFI